MSVKQILLQELIPIAQPIELGRKTQVLATGRIAWQGMQQVFNVGGHGKQGCRAEFYRCGVLDEAAVSCERSIALAGTVRDFPAAFIIWRYFW